MAEAQQKIHDEHVRLISLKPQIIGLDNVLLSTAESNLRNHKGIISRQPDNLLFDPYAQTLYNIEYKCHDTQSQYQHAKIQLESSRTLLQRIFKEWRIVNLYVTDSYRVNVLK